jgi:hypothetical protein
MLDRSNTWHGNLRKVPDLKGNSFKRWLARHNKLHNYKAKGMQIDSEVPPKWKQDQWIRWRNPVPSNGWQNPINIFFDSTYGHWEDILLHTIQQLQHKCQKNGN